MGDLVWNVRNSATAILCFAALSCFQPAVASNRGPDSNIALGRILWIRKQYSDAEPVLAAAVREEPANTEARRMHGSVLLHLGRYSEAEEELKKAVDPRDRSEEQNPILREIEACKIQKQDYSESLPAFEELSRNEYHQFDPSVMIDLARAYSKAGMTVKAHAEKAKAMRYGFQETNNTADSCEGLMLSGRTDAAIQIGEAANRDGNHSPALLRVLASAHARAGKFDSAIKEIGECCKTSDLCAKYWGTKGEYEAWGERYADAINDLTTALKLPLDRASIHGASPESQEFLWQILRTASFAKLKGLPAAIERVDGLMAGKSDASNVSLLYERGMLHNWMQDYDKAVSDFTSAIKADLRHENPYYYEARRNAYFMINNLVAARSDALKVISLSPSDFLSYVFLSTIDTRLQRYKDAAYDLNNAIYYDRSRHALLLECRAAAYYEVGDYPRAIADYTAAIARENSQSWLFAGRALAYLKANMSQQASKDLATLTTINPRQSTAYSFDSFSVLFPEPSSPVISKIISDRREQLRAAASKLLPGSWTAGRR